MTGGMVNDRTDGRCTTCGAARAPWVNTWTPPVERQYSHPKVYILGRECNGCYQRRRNSGGPAPRVYNGGMSKSNDRNQTGGPNGTPRFSLGNLSTPERSMQKRTNRTGSKTLYILSDNYDSQSVVVCQRHAAAMPDVNRRTVFAATADDDCDCEFCPAPTPSCKDCNEPIDYCECHFGDLDEALFGEEL